LLKKEKEKKKKGQRQQGNNSSEMKPRTVLVRRRFIPNSKLMCTGSLLNRCWWLFISRPVCIPKKSNSQVGTFKSSEPQRNRVPLYCKRLLKLLLSTVIFFFSSFFFFFSFPSLNNHRYDVIFIQELRQTTHTNACGNNTASAICALVAKMNEVRGFDNFQLVASPVVGKKQKKKKIKETDSLSIFLFFDVCWKGDIEQYVIVFDESLISVTDFQLYPDSQNAFSRTPHLTKLSVFGEHEFWVSNVHTSPSRAETEIFAHLNVTSYVRNSIGWSGGLILLGDLNADGNYFDEDLWPQFFQASAEEEWIQSISDEKDTTVNTNTNYTYDRILLSQHFSSNIVGPGLVFYYDKEMNLSTIAM
jgi:hypothetical protein